MLMNLNTGAELWNFSNYSILKYPPVISNGFVFVSSDTKVYALSIDDHQEKWSYAAGGHLSVGQNHLYVASQHGELYAFKEMSVGVDEKASSNNSVSFFKIIPIRFQLLKKLQFLIIYQKKHL